MHQASSIGSRTWVWRVWIIGGERFETLVLQSDRQITRAILTPPTPSGLANIANSAAIWVVKRGQAEPRVETMEDGAGPVIITRLIQNQPSWQ